MADGSEYRDIYVFRYRNLIADTLAEHRVVIDREGACWWGWWKRPSEDARTDVWTSLSGTIATEGRVTIGLFDSGLGRLFLARANRVVEPEVGDFGELEAVRPPTDESRLIPAYYRDSIFSRGWLKLEEIRDTSRRVEDLSFASPPSLEGFTSAQLASWVDKRVTDAAELRAMDTTIWHLRPAAAHDRRERVVAARPHLHEPADPEPVSSGNPWLLHITDPHFAVNPHRSEHLWRLDSEDGGNPTLVNQIALSLSKADRKVGAVVVTGDLTYMASAAEFDEARTSLLKLVTGELGLGMQHLVVVPGNHDIAWTKGDKYEPGAEVGLAPAEATRAYRKFFKSLYSYEANPDLSMARRFVFPGGNVIDVAGVNSSSLEQGKHFLSGMGRVQEHALEHLAQTLQWQGKSYALRVLALHHHLSLIEDLEPERGYGYGFGIAVDAPRILRMSARNGAHLILHGHKHRSFVGRTGVYELPDKTRSEWELGELNILGGGTAGSSDTDTGDCHFNLLRLSEGEVTLEIYRSSQQGVFECVSTWKCELARTKNVQGICLTPWRKT